MRKLVLVTALMAGAFALSACGHTKEQRAATGAIGGAVVGQVLGGSTAATIGGAVVGGVAGAVTAPKN